MLLKALQNYKGLGPLALRLYLGILFILFGLDKLKDIPGSQGAFQTMFGLPGWTAVLVGLVELVAGILLILGLATREASLALAIIIFVAMTKTNKFGLRIGGDPPLGMMPSWNWPIFVGLLALLFIGAGTLALDNKFSKK